MYCIHVEQQLQVLFDASVLQMFVAFVEDERSALSKDLCVPRVDHIDLDV